MAIIKRSISIYAAGYVFGMVFSAVLILVYPPFYFAFLEFLRQKVAAQSKLIENLALMIIANNILAAGIASFGGTGVSKIVNIFDSEIARRKAVLYFLPLGILFVNGGVLGFFAVLYREHVFMYLSRIFPHGFFEIPAIILSGAIGLAISEESQGVGEDFQRDLNGVAKRKLSRFGIVVLLIIIGGLLEGGFL